MPEKHKIENFIKSAKACLENAERLLNDIEFLKIESYPTAYALAIIAQ